MPKRKVGVGGTTSGFAKTYGFFWRTIWEHPENAGLRAMLERERERRGDEESLADSGRGSRQVSRTGSRTGSPRNEEVEMY